MPKREWHSFFDQASHEPCTIASSEHLSRRAPREDGFHPFGAGTVIPMKRRPLSIEGAGNEGEPMPPSDTQRMTDQIGRQLRGMYDGILNQPIPDRFADLMKRLERGDQSGGDSQ